MGTNIYSKTSQDQLTLEELDLYHAIMAYRADLGLDPIPLSKALTTTAGRHVADTRDNIWGADLDLPNGANLHSWSDAFYYGDHRDPEAMWDAPERLGTGYTSPGFEISAAGYANADAALAGWKASPGHNTIITNSGAWSNTEFNAIGIGVDTSPGAGIYAGRVYHVWFGTAEDSTGTLKIRGTKADDEILGTAFRDVIEGAAGNDEIRGGDGSDRIDGAAGNDRLFGGKGSEKIFGGGGNDSLHGGNGSDQLRAGSGSDDLSGGKGSDLLDGGAGKDVLEGGSGNDVFRFRPDAEGKTDTIVDFDRGKDHLDLGRLASALPGGSDKLEFIGDSRFDGTAGEVRFADGRLRVDLDGDGSADVRVDLTGVSALNAGDLWLA